MNAKRGLLHVALVALLVREEPVAVVVLAQVAQEAEQRGRERGLFGHQSRASDSAARRQMYRSGSVALEQRKQLAFDHLRHRVARQRIDALDHVRTL
jgi:hypothetical protein